MIFWVCMYWLVIVAAFWFLAMICFWVMNWDTVIRTIIVIPRTQTEMLPSAVLSECLRGAPTKVDSSKDLARSTPMKATPLRP